MSFDLPPTEPVYVIESLDRLLELSEVRDSGTSFNVIIKGIPEYIARGDDGRIAFYIERMLLVFTDHGFPTVSSILLRCNGLKLKVNAHIRYDPQQKEDFLRADEIEYDIK